MNENIVQFKGTKNGIIVMLDENSPYEELKKALDKKSESAKDFFKGARTDITFSGFSLTAAQEVELAQIINKNTGMDISSALSGGTPSISSPRFASSARKDDGALNQLLSEALVTAKKNLTTFHRGAVRSGQSIRFPGSIVVIGDVNPGGELIAEGNIIVLGILKGLAHAGCSGSHDCFVAALDMRPTQLRIAELIACFPDEKAENTPLYAYINENQIFVEPLL